MTPFDPIPYLDEMKLMTGKSWASWRTVVKGIYGVQLDAAERETFQKVAGRPDPGKPFEETYVFSGRRSGKSYASAVLACITALFGAYERELAPGERAWIFVVATDRAQCQVILDYCRGILRDYEPAVEDFTRDEIRFRNGAVISVRPASLRSMRGYSTSLIILDEFCFFRDKDGVANPVRDIVASLTPTLMPGGKLLAISTPWARAGYAWEVFKSSYGKEDPDVLVVKSDTRTLNPEFSDRKIAKAFRRDPVAAKTEWEAEFRADLESFVSREVLERSTMAYECLIHDPRREYRAFVDASGGSRDRYAVAVAYEDGGAIIVARVAWWTPPFDPDAVTASVCEILKEFSVWKVTGDRYAAEWVARAFQKRDIVYEAAGKSKSEIYLSALALLNSGRVRLPSVKLLQDEVASLERRSRAGGQDVVDHPEGGSDDLANAALGAAVLAWRELAEGPTPREIEARMPVMKKHYKQTVQETIRDFNRDIMAEFGLAIPVKDAKKLGLGKR
ncbi:MAG: terminase family protein [Candidatus Aminicenantes bacterium]|nr:terminase family protein [Candidatus Aminicenantes bacterium]